jgi:2-dehydro-3-deoxygalactonokinase
MPPAAAPSYLSGLVIGDELRAQGLERGAGAVVVIGAPALAARYRLALDSLGVAVTTVGAQAAWRGLHAIARQLEQAQ